MNINSAHEHVEKTIGNAFAKYGRFVSRHAWKILIITVIVNGALGIGILNITSNIDVNVYLPQDTQAMRDKKTIEDLFPDLSGSKYNYLQNTPLGAFAHIIVKSKAGNLLNRESLEEIGRLNNVIENVTATADDGSIIKYSRICAITNSKCAFDSGFLWSTEFLAAVDSKNVTSDLFKEYSSVDNSITTLYRFGFGGHISADGKHLKGMECVYLNYVIRTDGDLYKDLASLWVDAFIKRMDTYTSPNIDMAYIHHNSVGEELDKNVRGDIALCIVTMVLMIVYSCSATLTARITDQVSQRMWLGFGGTLAAVLAIVSGFGCVALCGVEFVSIVGVVPFLIIGIGIDDMFILLSGLAGAQTQKTVGDKIAETLRTSGVAITITSLTDFLAFMVGAGSNYIAIQNFCIYTGVAVTFCYINNLTFFAACLAINERRNAENRHCGTCRPIKTKERLREEGRSKCFITCCGGRPPTSRNEAESWLDKFARWLLPRIVSKTPCKIVIIILFISYLAASMYGCLHLKQGMKLEHLVNDDSYYHKYIVWVNRYYGQRHIITFVIDSTYFYSNEVTQSLIRDLITSAHGNQYVDDQVQFTDWLTSYKQSTFYNDSNETSFISGFRKFTSISKFAGFENDVIINADNSEITASRLYVLSKDMLGKQEDKPMLETRAIANSARISCFAYNHFFVAYEQYVTNLGQVLKSVGIALAAVFVVTCIFMPHPIIIIFLTVTVTMIMVGLFGVLYYLDMTLSFITMVYLIMSIGFSIDFTAHICHGYITSRGETRDIRVKEAIDKAGAPVFHGAVSSMLGVIVLVGAKSYICTTFAIFMTFVLVIGIAHALLFLPVVLSWIGPWQNVSTSVGNNSNTIESKPEVPDAGTQSL